MKKFVVVLPLVALLAIAACAPLPTDESSRVATSDSQAPREEKVAGIADAPTSAVEPGLTPIAGADAPVTNTPVTVTAPEPTARRIDANAASLVPSTSSSPPVAPEAGIESEVTEADSIQVAVVGGIQDYGPAPVECQPTPPQTEGPFYFNDELFRRNITEGKLGTPLLVRLRLLDAESCQPISGAVMAIWHTDAAGHYSGYPDQGDERLDTSGETFLRGRQITGADGFVEFETIYPGWYPGRTPHIHFKAYLDDGPSIASQLYFPDEISDAVYGTGPYGTRPQRGTVNSNDFVLNNDREQNALLGQVTGNESGYAVFLNVTVSR